MELDAEIVGYADVQNDGYIDHFFVSRAHPRMGIGRVLMQEIHAKGSVQYMRIDDPATSTLT